MKKTYIGIFALGMLALFSSCRKWVDVKPNDRLLEDNVYSDPDNLRGAVNGIYSNVAARDLYGQFMTLTAVDALAQLNCGMILNSGGSPENVNSGTAAKPYTDYTYQNEDLKKAMNSAWTRAYRTVLNINLFLSNLDKYPAVVSNTEMNMYRGELLGLRAMLHFDMLRLFGPVYLTDSTALSVPYYTTGTPNAQPRIPATQAIDSILADLGRSLAFLADDPILTAGKQDKIENDGNDFNRMRNLRMNWYAARALQARVLLYRNNKPAAYAVATELIGKLDAQFPWFNTSSGRNPVDRAFSQEVIFAVNVPNLYDWTRTLFAGNVEPEQMWAPNSTRLNAVYENNLTTDYRYSNNLPFGWWEVPSGGEIGYRTLRKFNDVDGDAVQFRYRMPMIRKSEIYYIAAECAPDDATGFTYLNTVREKRGLLTPPLTATLQTEIMKEYAKEFYGEGQLFYYYKRTNANRILKANTIGTTNSNYQTMTPAQYVVPLPDGETYYQ